MRSLRSAKPAARRPAAARSASFVSARMATRKPLGWKTIGREEGAGSWSLMPTGQTTSLSATAVLPQGVGQCLLDGRRTGAELVGDLAAVHHERFGELVLHLHQLAHR